MRILAFDTSGGACSVALFEDENVISYRHEIVGRGHAERLIPWIAALPEGGRADQILVGCGPGSFTGVRIAISAARGLALGWRVRVHGFSTLALIAAGTASKQPVTVAIEAGHGELFVQRFGMLPIAALGELISQTPQEAAARSAEKLAIGNGAARLITARGWGEALSAEADAVNVLRLPETMRLLPPGPIYGRLPDAKATA